MCGYEIIQKCQVIDSQYAEGEEGEEEAKHNGGAPRQFRMIFQSLAEIDHRGLREGMASAGTLFLESLMTSRTSSTLTELYRLEMPSRPVSGMEPSDS